MSGSPIYDELVGEIGATVPLCPICGRIALSGLCGRCFEMGLTESNWPEAWDARHCHDCGTFLACTWFALTDEVPERLGVVVCAEHCAERMGKHAVWNPQHMDSIEIVDELPPPNRVFPQITTSASLPLGVQLIFDAANPPWGSAPTVIYDELTAEMAAA